MKGEVKGDLDVFPQGTVHILPGGAGAGAEESSERLEQGQDTEVKLGARLLVPLEAARDKCSS